MIRLVFAVFSILLAVVITLLLLEGGNAIVRWSDFRGSVTYNTFLLVKSMVRQSDEQADLPVYARMPSRAQLDGAIADFKAANAGLGNTPYSELESDEAAVNTRLNGCLRQKPNLNKQLAYLRSNLFNPLNPPFVFFNKDTVLAAKAKQIVETYGVQFARLRTDDDGWRVTEPQVSADTVVLVAGDSVALGAGIDDSETIASQLQVGDATRRYVNLGIGSAKASDVLCALDSAVQQFAGAIDELIYVYCENDFRKNDPFGTPGAAMQRLVTLIEKQRIEKVTIVYAPYVYNVVPQITRFRGYKGGRAKTRAKERRELERLARQAGYRYIDVAELALENASRRKTQFAALSLFVDHVHLSPYGTRLLVERLRQTEH